MTTLFDQKKSILEEIEGLMTVKKAISHIVRLAEQKIGEAEIQLNAARVIEGFLKIELERKQTVLREILKQEKEKEQSN